MEHKWEHVHWPKTKTCRCGTKHTNDETNACSSQPRAAHPKVPITQSPGNCSRRRALRSERPQCLRQWQWLPPWRGCLLGPQSTLLTDATGPHSPCPAWCCSPPSGWSMVAATCCHWEGLDTLEAMLGRFVCNGVFAMAIFQPNRKGS